ncbi:MAG: ATP-binding cassette domain-containing protein [Verrucomicrobium sp.]|nr:ATP-binding cassette domain-containing protein [Verrucomicrobium sp.]
MRVPAGTAIGNGAQRVAAFAEAVDFDAHRLILLRGPNGSGKTTLLKTLQGLVHHRAPDTLSALRHTLYLPERLDWADELSFAVALDALCLLPYRDVFTTLAKRLDLPQQTPYGILSKGNRQKMSVLLTEAVGWSRQIDWLLLDEPLSGLDPAAQGTLIEFWNSSTAAHRRIISSHGDLTRFSSALILHLAEGSISPVTAPLTTSLSQDA